MKKQKPRTTVSLSEKEFRHALERMKDGDWERGGDKQGISRYVQELIRADMRGEPFAPPIPSAGKPAKKAGNPTWKLPVVQKQHGA
jgi:hypothetical protein